MWIAESYAKINLGLNVLDRLPTGNHTIESGYAFLEWADRFEVRQAPKSKLDIEDNDLPTDGAELINKAVKAIDRYIGLNHHYHIRVNKRIPAGSGLGSASSNAALILRMLNKIENLELTDDELIDLSRNLADDIPFFIKGNTGIVHGLRRDIEPMDIQPGYWIVTCFPNDSSSTAEAYRNCQPNPQPDFGLKEILTKEPVDEWSYMLTNDLEQAVFPRIRVAGNLKDQMYEFGALYASMAGSGSAVYGLFEQNFVATAAYKNLLKLEYPANLTRPGFSPDYGIYKKDL